MPNRSASSITMTVASGTSTPTSITVVATSTCDLARPEGGHDRLLLGRLQLAVQQAERSPARTPSASRSYSSVAERASTRSEPSTSGQTT